MSTTPRNRIVVFCMVIVSAIRLVAADSAAKVEPTGKFRLAEHDLYPESIAFDPVSGDFFLDSMGRPRILRIDSDGSYEDFLTDETPGIASSIGMKVDAKRRKLWVCTGRFSLLADYAATAPRTGVPQFDIDSGELVRAWMLDQEQESPYHIFNDLALTASGEVVPLTVPDDEDLGTNGLSYYEGSLIAVKPRLNKISRLFLDDEFTRSCSTPRPTWPPLRAGQAPGEVTCARFRSLQ